MKLIRDMGKRLSHDGKDRIVKIGLYVCVACGKEVQLTKTYARNKSACGCQNRSQKHTIYRPKPAERRCLMCGKRFMSRGPHNRLCVLCEKKLDGDGQAYYMPPVHKQRDHSVVAECFET